MDTPIYKMVMKIYPWVSEKDARRIGHEAEVKRNDHMFDEAQKLRSIATKPSRRPISLQDALSVSLDSLRRS